MPKILYFITEDWFFMSHFVAMARAAREEGFEVTIATRVNKDADRIAGEGFRLIALDADRKSLRLIEGLRNLLRSYGIVRRERPDIVHCIALRPIVLGGTAAKLAQAKALLLAPTGLGYLWLEPGSAIAIIRSLVRGLIGSWLRGPRTHYLFENRDDPHEFGLGPDDPDVTIIGGAGVNERKFPLVSEPPSPPVKVAVVARMLSSKGIREAIEAAQQARRMGAPVELSLYGEPDASNPSSLTESMLREWSKIPGVNWRGSIPDVTRVWQDHHIALLLSHREGLPRTLVEAAASGRPIVTTDVVGCRELVRNGQEGFLVTLGDRDAAAQALAKLALDASLRQRMGLAAHARFRECFTEDAVRTTIKQLYRRLAHLQAHAGSPRQP
jgi:glycosyltransferase involved in cell wall biosynthesis